MILPRQFAGIGGVVALLLCWEALIDFGLVEFDSLPPPSQILLALIALAQNSELYIETAHTLLATLLGWVIAASIGVTVGAALGLSATARDFSVATIEFLRPLPGIAFAPVALLLFGFSLQTELVVIIIPTIWPALTNTVAGLASVPGRLRDVSRAFRIPPITAVRIILIPAAAPSVLVGCQLSLTLALIMAVSIEMIGNPAGLGYAVIREQQALNPPGMFAYIVIIGFIGAALNHALKSLFGIVVPQLAQRR